MFHVGLWLSLQKNFNKLLCNIIVTSFISFIFSNISYEKINKKN
jgi:hypothetical protein